MTNLDTLREALQRWVKMERHPGQPEVQADDRGNGVTTVTVMAYPEAPTTKYRADVHFALIAPTEGFPERADLIAAVVAALDPSEMTADDLVGGPSYITLGAWLGSQELALRLIGAVQIAEIADAVTPAVLGVEGEMADQMAGNGFVMLGPTMCWTQEVGSDA